MWCDWVPVLLRDPGEIRTPRCQVTFFCLFSYPGLPLLRSWHFIMFCFNRTFRSSEGVEGIESLPSCPTSREKQIVICGGWQHLRSFQKCLSSEGGYNPYFHFAIILLYRLTPAEKEPFRISQLPSKLSLLSQACLPALPVLEVEGLVLHSGLPGHGNECPWEQEGPLKPAFFMMFPNYFCNLHVASRSKRELIGGLYSARELLNGISMGRQRRDPNLTSRGLPCPNSGLGSECFVCHRHIYNWWQYLPRTPYLLSLVGSSSLHP